MKTLILFTLSMTFFVICTKNLMSNTKPEIFFNEKCKIQIKKSHSKIRETSCIIVLDSNALYIKFEKDGFDIGDGEKTKELGFFYCGISNIEVIKKGSAFKFKRGNYMYFIESKNSIKIVKRFKFMMAKKHCELNKK